MKIDENLLVQCQIKAGKDIHNYLNLETLYGGFINIFNYETSSQEKKDICEHNIKLIEKWFRQFLVTGKLISYKDWSNGTQLKRW